MIDFPCSCLSHYADGRGYPVDAKARVCPTCRGIGKVSVLKIQTDDDQWFNHSGRICFVRMISHPCYLGSVTVLYIFDCV